MSDKRKLSQHTSQAGNMQRRRPHNETTATSSSPLISHSCGTVAFAFLARLHHNAAAGARLRLRCEHAQVTSMLQSEVTFPLRASDMMQARPTGAADRCGRQGCPAHAAQTTLSNNPLYPHELHAQLLKGQTSVFFMRVDMLLAVRHQLAGRRCKGTCTPGLYGPYCFSRHSRSMSAARRSSVSSGSLNAMPQVATPSSGTIVAVLPGLPGTPRWSA